MMTLADALARQRAVEKQIATESTPSVSPTLPPSVGTQRLRFSRAIAGAGGWAFRAGQVADVPDDVAAQVLGSGAAAPTTEEPTPHGPPRCRNCTFAPAAPPDPEVAWVCPWCGGWA
jgi:hypothetical protein